MATLHEIWPPFGLRVTAGPLELRDIRDCDIPDLVELAAGGIHDADAMPFAFPWSTAPADQLPADMARYYWRTRAEFTRAKWSLNLLVAHEGTVVGCQGFMTEHYPVTRTGETGSWLGRRHQGKGIGTLMRQTICALLFDHLGAQQITSAAFTDNPASLAVSRKTGYRINGRRRRERRPGELAVSTELVLEPGDLVRAPYDVEVDGVELLRRFIGL